MSIARSCLPPCCLPFAPLPSLALLALHMAVRLSLPCTVDALYFSVVTISTVGYGDISPSTDGSRLFTTIYILFGVTIVLSLTGEAFDAAIRASESAMKGSFKTALRWIRLGSRMATRMCAAVRSKRSVRVGMAGGMAQPARSRVPMTPMTSPRAERTEVHSRRLTRQALRLVPRKGTGLDAGVVASAAQPAWRFYVTGCAWYLLLGIGLFQFGAAWLFTRFDPSLSFGHALWHCWVTATTVG